MYNKRSKSKLKLYDKYLKRRTKQSIEEHKHCKVKEKLKSFEKSKQQRKNLKKLYYPKLIEKYKNTAKKA